MLNYIAQRLVLAALTLLGLTVLVFVLIRVVIPVDTIDVALAASESNADPDHAQRLREEYGLDGPLPVQYLRWLGGVVTGDFGTSFYTRQPVASEIASKITVSAEVGLLALLITVMLAIPIGILSAVMQDSLPDYLLRGGAILFYAIPGFWIATLVLVFGSMWFNWAPSIEYVDFWRDPVKNLQHVYLPVLLLALAPIGNMIRLVRTQVLEVIRQDYVRTARAKGLAPASVYTRHVLRNSLLPIVTTIGLLVPSVVAGTVIFEQIFLLPGMGRYLLEAIQRLDLYVIMGTNLFFGALLILANLAVDMSYGFIDPRVRMAA